MTAGFGGSQQYDVSTDHGLAKTRGDDLVTTHCGYPSLALAVPLGRQSIIPRVSSPGHASTTTVRISDIYGHRSPLLLTRRSARGGLSTSSGHVVVGIGKQKRPVHRLPAQAPRNRSGFGRVPLWDGVVCGEDGRNAHDETMAEIWLEEDRQTQRELELARQRGLAHHST